MPQSLREIALQRENTELRNKLSRARLALHAYRMHAALARDLFTDESIAGTMKGLDDNERETYRKASISEQGTTSLPAITIEEPQTRPTQ